MPAYLPPDWNSCLPHSPLESLPCRLLWVMPPATTTTTTTTTTSSLPAPIPCLQAHTHTRFALLFRFAVVDFAHCVAARSACHALAFYLRSHTLPRLEHYYLRSSCLRFYVIPDYTLPHLHVAVLHFTHHTTPHHAATHTTLNSVLPPRTFALRFTVTTGLPLFTVPCPFVLSATTPLPLLDYLHTTDGC